MKCRVQIENFSGKTVHSVYQDFHAKVFSKNLTMMIVTSTHPELKKGRKTENTNTTSILHRRFPE
jgi:hypothetical protein